MCLTVPPGRSHQHSKHPDKQEAEEQAQAESGVSGHAARRRRRVLSSLLAPRLSQTRDAVLVTTHLPVGRSDAGHRGVGRAPAGCAPTASPVRLPFLLVQASGSLGLLALGLARSVEQEGAASGLKALTGPSYVRLR